MKNVKGKKMKNETDKNEKCIIKDEKWKMKNETMKQWNMKNGK